MGLGQNAVKWLMFIFNFIFFIIGIALISAGAVALTHYKAYSHFVANGTDSAAAFVIVIGVFIALVSFLGCCGAAREHFYMLMGFAVLVGIILIFQLSAGIAGYVQRGKIPGWVSAGLDTGIEEYKTGKDKATIDALQKSAHCCGNRGFADWVSLPAAILGEVPLSCCRSDITESECKSALNATTSVSACTFISPGAQCPIYVNGCGTEISNTLRYAMASVAGAAIGFAVVELIGVVFACFLARRIRRGYTYA